MTLLLTISVHQDGGVFYGEATHACDGGSEGNEWKIKKHGVKAFTFNECIEVLIADMKLFREGGEIRT